MLCHGDVVCLHVQGFPVQTVVNPGAPLVLNLQPGQTVQPLTLIQCRSTQSVTDIRDRCQLIANQPFPVHSPVAWSAGSTQCGRVAGQARTRPFRRSRPAWLNLHCHAAACHADDSHLYTSTR